MKKEFPKAYEPSLYEDGIYEKWLKSGYFNPDNLSLPENAPNYSIIMPPPNVTGVLHVGHASMLALEDILIRYYRMKGFRTLWLPGTDHAAIATATRVEQDLKREGTDRHQLGREKFLERVNRFAKQSHDTIVGQIKKMGSSCDWSREAYTLDEIRSKAVRSVFKLMYDDGLIYRGDRVVNWCPRCQSTLADDEAEYRTQPAKLYTFRYGGDFPISIATTRPETKLGDTAVAVNPKDMRFAEFIGKEFALNFAGVPIKIKIIADSSVEMEFGTGALGVTPAHSMSDWQLAQDNNLPVVKVIDERGLIREGFGEYSGQTTAAARARIIEKLRSQGLLEKEEEIENNLSLCYRCGTAIEPLPSLQWFIDVNKQMPRFGKSLKELALEAVRNGIFGRGKINIVPKRFEKNYFYWLNNLRDWCISRQIWFGHRVPVWYCRGEDKGRCLPECAKPIVSVEAPTECPACGSKDLVQDEDTLDTWFSSGLWTFSTLADAPEQLKIVDGKFIIDSDDFKKFHPTAVLETGYDILFFWVARMIIMTVYSVADIPFRDVYLHGLVKDEQGKKMSKSKGNVLDPLDVIKKFGTDALRLALVVGSAAGADLNLGENKIAGFRNFANKLWNVARFIIEKNKGKKISAEINGKNFTPADSWILDKFADLIDAVSADLDRYRFSQAGERLREFTWSDLADWYLEVSKLENNEAKPAILNYLLENLLILWHPFMPFVTEVIWSRLGQNELLLVKPWPKGEKKSETDVSGFELTKEIITAIRNGRTEHRIEPSKKISAVIYAEFSKELIENQLALIKSMRTGLNQVTVVETGEKIEGAIYLRSGGIEIYLLGARDAGKEAARLGKEITHLEKIIALAKAKLTNEEFLQKAPPAVVEQEQQKLSRLESDYNNLKKQLTNGSIA